MPICIPLYLTEQMKFWRVNIACNSELNDWLKKNVFVELIAFLCQREYSYVDRSGSSALISPDKNTFKLREDWNVDGNIFSVFVEIKTNWKSSNGKAPQIVHLISDYFKLNSKSWYFLEVLNEIEEEKISKTERLIEPFEIKEALKNWTGKSIPSKPDIIEIGDYLHQETDVYSGKKEHFKTHLDFWISCLYWVNCGSFEPNELFYHYIKNTHFDSECGSCIPMNFNEVEKITNFINTKSPDLSKPINAYLMRKDWNDKMFLFEYSHSYVLYHWHTAE